MDQLSKEEAEELLYNAGWTADEKYKVLYCRPELTVGIWIDWANSSICYYLQDVFEETGYFPLSREGLREAVGQAAAFDASIRQSSAREKDTA